MSMGIGGFCHKLSEDDTEVVYEYSSYNLNDARYINENRTADGFIEISRSVYDKEQVKDVSCFFSVKELADAGKIIIRNCTNTWRTYDGYDIIALRLCRKLICEYQVNRRYPEIDGCHM